MPPKSRAVSPDAREKWLRLLDEQIAKYLGESRFNAEFLAATMQLSSRQLQRRIRELTGYSINLYIREARLQLGRRLLESGDYLVKQAAAEAGYRDPHYFSTLYRERFGILPTDT